MRQAWISALTLLGAASAVHAETVTLERSLKRGERVRVEERTHSVRTNHYTGRDAAGHRGSGGNEETSEVRRTYVEEVLSPQPARFVRTYESSTRAKFRAGDDPTPARTSLHDRRIRVQGLGMEPDEPFEISKEDREALRLDRLAFALLPPQKVVERGETWTLSSEVIGRALWGGYVAADNLEGSGAKVEFKTIRERKGVLVATLKVKKLVVHLEPSEPGYGVDMSLRGEILWAVEEGVMLQADLEGRLKLSATHRKDGAKGLWTSEGDVTWSYAATVLEAREQRGEGDRQSGEPPPPGTQVMVCERDPNHRLKVAELRFCARCGKELSREAGCEDHAWVFQHCPHDGAPFRPE